MEYFIPRQRQSPILQMLQDAAVHAAAQQHQNPFAQFTAAQRSVGSRRGVGFQEDRPHHRARAYVEADAGPAARDLMQRRLRGGTVVRGAPAQIRGAAVRA